MRSHGRKNVRSTSIFCLGQSEPLNWHPIWHIKIPVDTYFNHRTNFLHRIKAVKLAFLQVTFFEDCLKCALERLPNLGPYWRWPSAFLLFLFMFLYFHIYILPTPKEKRCQRMPSVQAMMFAHPEEYWPTTTSVSLLGLLCTNSTFPNTRSVRGLCPKLCPPEVKYLQFWTSSPSLCQIWRGS